MTDAPQTMTDASFRWIDSTSWELPFFGLPQRIPWPATVEDEVANRSPFEMEHLLDAIDLMGPDPGDPWQAFRLAANTLEELSEVLEDTEVVRARELLEEFENLYPGTAFSLYHQGLVARLEGREEEALQLYRAAAEKTPAVPAIWNNIGILLAMRGEREGAVDAFRRVLALAPQDHTALEGLAQLREVVKLLRDANDPSSAVYVDQPTFRKMVVDQLNQISNNPDEVLARGEQLIRDGLAPDLGVQAIQRALQLRPDDARTLLAMTAAWRLAGQTEEARKTAARFTELYPQEPQGWFHLAQAYHASGDAANEQAALDKVLEFDPNAQQAIGIRFQISPTEHDPAKEEALMKFAAQRNSWMAYIMAGELARRRADAAAAVRCAERAFAISPEAEDVILHYAVALGDARDVAKLASIIKPQLDSGKFSKRLDWNYAQVLHQLGMAKDAVGVLRKAAAASDAPDSFKQNAGNLIDAWTGVLTGCGVPLEVHDNGFLIRPVLLVLGDRDGGVVLNAGSPLPVTGSFPWRASGTEARVTLQQGQTGSATEPRPLGVFLIREVQNSPPSGTAVECQIAALPDGAIHFRALQDGRKLPVGWIPPSSAK